MDYDDLSRRMGSEEQRKLQAWNPGSEAERIALYRRVWGPAWGARCTDAAGDGTTSREELISRNLIVVETIAATLLRAGQNPFIEKDDLLQVGYAELIRTIDRPPNGALALEKRIARNCRTAMIRFVESERRERRYVEQGKMKAIRDTRAVLGRPVTEGESGAEDTAAPEAAEEFRYPDWLLGSVSVCHLGRAYVFNELQNCDLPPELAEIAHRVGYQFKHMPARALRSCLRPKLECLRHAPPRQRTSQDILQDPVLI
jgi:hypothetical protein